MRLQGFKKYGGVEHVSCAIQTSVLEGGWKWRCVFEHIMPCSLWCLVNNNKLVVPFVTHNHSTSLDSSTFTHAPVYVKIILIILHTCITLGISRITVKQQRVGQDSSKDNILLVFFGMEQKCNYDA